MWNSGKGAGRQNLNFFFSILMASYGAEAGVSIFQHFLRIALAADKVTVLLVFRGVDYTGLYRLINDCPG
jgi:hypothetical protein